MNERQKSLLKSLPKVDEVLAILETRGTLERAPREKVLEAIRETVGWLRAAILAGTEVENGLLSNESTADAVVVQIERLHDYHLRRVINATGIILHTNLGRAPLCKEALERIVEVSRGYSNLEFDLAEGKRGLRYDHVRGILCELTGAEDVLVVNNNAAAVLLVLSTLARGREAIVSRGELIEIGGEFRIPEVMERSGAVLREVGATNRTHLSDYEKAINENTALIMKVHTSNFRIVGFTEEVPVADLVALSRRHGIPVMNDLGSGCFIRLDRYGLQREPTVRDAVKEGADVITFSGDKLLGGPQAGIIVGKKDLLESIKKNPLNRALRIDKLTLAALEATAKLYLNESEAVAGLRSLTALTEPVEAATRRAKRLLQILKRENLPGVTLALKKGSSMSGGGSLPTQQIPTLLVALRCTDLSVSRIDEKLRALPVPVVARIAEDEILFDPRTLAAEELAEISNALKAVLASSEKR
ncbi:MAG TPA: L-seryl-tRNA(Sec) selenium transferase [Syntrophales bacterium]|nr:L-seryl-tRNA(Sec) selenium transferase [Syntrophales bacterium]